MQVLVPVVYRMLTFVITFSALVCGSFAVTFPEISLQRYRQIYYLDHISEWEFNPLILSAFRIEPQHFSVHTKPKGTSGNEKLPEFSDGIREPWE